MNSYVMKLHLKVTRYTNPHGLVDKANHSTAYELAQISAHAMKNPLIREIVSCKTYQTGLTYLPQRRFTKRHPEWALNPPPTIDASALPFDGYKAGTKFVQYGMTWYNSNRLLTVKGFSGIKTGITPTAGSCLSVFYEDKYCRLVTVVLGSRSIEHRWKDTLRLTLWAAAQIRQEQSSGQLQSVVATANVNSGSPMKR